MKFTTSLSAVILWLPFATSQTCKCRPVDPCWPSESNWSALNQTIGGRLIKAVPPASVCYPLHPNYNATACTKVWTQWPRALFHISDPISIGSPYWAGNSCPPIDGNGTSITGDTAAGIRGCSIGKYPVYVVNATEANDIQTAVKFAKEKNIRLVIKNTGHSYIGRSTGYGSLSIWTHNMKKITFHESFQPQNCPLKSSKPQMAATLSAGIQDIDMYAEMDKHNAAIVGGANPTVGVMGWFTGGGHGPLSSSYGMGADNVLEATVVLPSGDIVVTNACEHPDLFFALRGGGGGTYGVILSVVMKAHPTPRTSHQMFFMTSKNKQASSRFYDAAAYLLSEMPRLKEGGMQGYFGLSSFGTRFNMTGPTYRNFSSDRVLSFNWGFYLYNKPNGTAEALFEPIKQKLSTDFNDSVTFFSRMSEAPSFYQQYRKAPGYEAMAVSDGWMGGWLLPSSSFTNLTKLAEALAIAGPSVEGSQSTHITGHFASPNHNPDLDLNSVAVNPAWRESVVDLILWTPYPVGSSKRVVSDTANLMTNVKMKALKDIAPNSGGYFNECDTNDPDWQHSFFGRNYNRLLNVKRRYDPEDLFWCRNCVGSERWTEQDDGKLCLNL